MGTALVKGVLSASIIDPSLICVVEPDNYRRNQLETELPGLNVSASVVAGSGYVVATKPKDVRAVLSSLVSCMEPDQLPPVLISIAAGISTKDLDEWSGKRFEVVRAMSNTPALVNKAMTVYCGTPTTGQAALDLALRIFSSVGDAMEMPESQLDAVTALSGSGPAYVFFLVEALEEAGVTLGLSLLESRRLVLQTLEGSVELLRGSGSDPRKLRLDVTSPGGTTAAAISALEAGCLRATVLSAVRAAHSRSKELGSEYS